MFTIFGGATAFTQWQKDQKVTNPNMTAGDPVYFAASNGESYPTRAYISGGDVVADVPNELLTMHKPFTARLDDHDEPVTIFRVEAADKPSGYVYEDNMNKTHAPGDVVIPAGATLTLEEGAKVNDKAGVLATAGGSGETVILPETELTVAGDANPIMTAPNAMPEVGAVCTVTYNGTAYDCPAVAAVTEEVAGIAFGNTDVLGIPGGNANAPFFVALFDMPMDVEGVSVYGMLVPMEEFAEGTYVTLSIVQTEGAESGGESAGSGIFEVSVPVTKYIASTGHDFGEFDKTFAELAAAQKAGKIVRINVNWNNEGITYGNVIGYAQIGGLEVVYISMPQSFTMANQTAAYVLTAGENGEIVAERLSTD